MKKKTDNRGMTVLEVIIAVSIFAIAATILFKGFVTSGRINRKSGFYLEATSVAQNIMEEIKSKEFGDVALTFNYPIDPITEGSRIQFLDPQKQKIKDGVIGIREVLKNDDGTFSDVALYQEAFGDDVSKVTASVISKDEGKTYEFNARKDGSNASKYYYEMTGVKNDLYTFDALIEFDGSTDSGYKGNEYSTDEGEKNDYLSPNIVKLDSKSNAFLAIGPKYSDWIPRDEMNRMINQQFTKAKQLWKAEYNKRIGGLTPNTEEFIRAHDEFMAEYKEPEKLDPADVYKYMKRKLILKITEESDGSASVSSKRMASAFEYEKENGSQFENFSICPCNGQGMDESVEKNAECFCTYREEDYTMFYSSETNTELKNLYLFYYPNYNSVSSTKPLDEIILDNTANHKLQFYVTKQRDEVNNVPNSVQESMYRMLLTIQEKPSAAGNSNWNTNLGLFRAQTKLLTNLTYNISDMDQVLNRPRIDLQMKLVYEDVRDSGVNRKVSSSGSKKVLSMNGLDDRAAKDRIYLAKVSVYKEGAADKDYPEEELVATLDGAKED